MKHSPRSSAKKRLQSVSLPESPLGWHLSRSAYLGLFLGTRAEPAGPAKAFRDRERVLEALAHDMVAIDQTIRIGARITTVGRFLVSECFPPAFRDDAVAAPCTATSLATLLSRIVHEEHVEIAGRAAEALEALGRTWADRSGLSPTLADFAPPPEKDEIIREAMEGVARVTDEYQEGLITDGERFNKTVDHWADAKDRSHYFAKRRDDAFDPLAAVAATDPAAPCPEQLRGMVGLMTKYSGEILEVPVIHAHAEGVNAHECSMMHIQARGESLLALERNEKAATLFRDLHAVLGETVIVSRDCGTKSGIRVTNLAIEFEIAVTLASRIAGRVAAADVLSPDGTIIASTGTLITAVVARRIHEAGVASVLIRDPLVCDASKATQGGVCAACFGLDPDDATWLCTGDEIGARAALTIAREARLFSRRWFHIC